MNIDYKKFAECFSLVDNKTGDVLQPKYWDMHPGSTEVSEEFGCTRKDSVKLWEDHKERVGAFIPYVAHLQQQKKGASVLWYTSQVEY